MSDYLQPHELQHARLSCPSPSPGACSNSCPLSRWWTSNHFILCHPLLFLPSIFLIIRVFSNESALHIRWLKIGASASATVFSMNIQGWFLLGLTGFISLLSRGLSTVFSTPQFKSINSSTLCLLYGSTLTFVHDYWKNHSFDYMDLYQQNDVSDF